MEFADSTYQEDITARLSGKEDGTRHSRSDSQKDQRSGHGDRFAQVLKAITTDDGSEYLPSAKAGTLRYSLPILM